MSPYEKKKKKLNRGGYGIIYAGRRKAVWDNELGEQSTKEFNKAIKVTECTQHSDKGPAETRAFHKSLLRDLAAYEMMAGSGTVLEVEGVCIEVNEEARVNEGLHRYGKTSRFTGSDVPTKGTRK